MKKKFNLFLLLFVFLPCIFLLSACVKQPVKFDIKFMVDGQTYATVETGGNETIAMPENPTKEDYTFDGWYWDQDVWQRPFTANSLLNAPLSSDMKVYAKFTFIHTHNLTKMDKKEPTCTENGYEEYYTCECGKMFSDENGTTEISKINILSANGHTFSEWYELKPASYTEKGTERRDCSICGYYEIRDIEKLVVEIVDPTELNVEYGILKWDGTSPYGFDVIVNGESQKVLGNSLETQLKSDDYNSVCVACIYENGTKGNYIELNNFVVNAPISNLHFTDNGTNVTFTWDSASELYDYTFVVNNQGITVPKNKKTYSIPRNTVAAGSEISVYVNGVDSANFKPSKKTTIKLEQLDHPNLSINKLDVEWENVENSEYYLVKGLTNITTTDTKYSYDGASSGDYTITVEVYGDDYLYNSSTLTFKKLIKPDISIENKIVSWNAIAGQVRYATLFNNNETKFSANSFKLEEINTEYEMFLYASPVQSNSMQSDVIVIKQFVYEDYSNIYWGNVFNNKISYNKVMPSNILYVPECCQNVDFSSINNQNITLISNKRPDLLKSSLIVNCLIPNSVTSIGDYVFSGCSGLTSITISSGVTSIGGYAFEGCSGLTSITIQDGLTSIGDYAFSGCSGLTSITIPDSVTSIGEGAFKGCNNLASITLPFVGSSKEVYENEYSYSSKFGYIFGYATSNKTGTIYDGYRWYYYIPQTLRNVIITKATGISANAFYGCSYLTSVTLNKEVTVINSRAFYNCSGLTSFTIPENTTTIRDYAFYGCSSMSTLTFNEKVSTIGDYAFYGCVKVTEIDLPKTLTTIGDCAFYNTRLKTLTIPSKVNSIGTHAFEKNVALTELVIPGNVKTIGSYAFSDCTQISKLTLTNGITTIGDYAFQNCSGLTSITIPSGVTSIGGYAFYGCSGLTSITIPDSVTSIGNSAFYGCSGLTSITIPSGVTSVGYFAFYGCSALTEVYISNLVAWFNITFGNQYANPLVYAHHLYLNGAELTEIEIPDGITKIYNYALCGASSITSITIPDSVTSIGNGAFSGCSGITSITIPAGVASIGNYAFQNCSGLTSITIPDSVTSIGDGAFSGCSGLTSITIPDSVTSMGHSTFYGCSGLTSITIPSSVTSIGSYAFDGCSGLTIYCEATSKPTDWSSNWNWSAHWNISNLPVYWYSETQPTESGNYWHYVDGEVTKW